MTTGRGPLESGELIPFFRGRAALYHFLDALGVGPGDEVAIQAFTCLAVPLPILALGATPVYVDINPDDLGMNPEDLRRKIGPKTRAVIIQHTLGIPAGASALTAVAEEAGAVVIEDCCHVLDAAVDGQPVGTFGSAAFYSFEWGKPLVAGVGGGIVVHDPDLRDELRRRAETLTPPPLKRRLVLEAQYRAFRTLLTGRTYWAVRGLYNTLSRMGLIVGTFDTDELDLEPGGEYEWAMAPGTRRRLERSLDRISEIVAHQRRLTEAYEAELELREIPTWAAPEGRDAVFMRYPYEAADKEALLDAARLARVEVSGMFKTVVDPLGPEGLARIGYQVGSCSEAERTARSLVSFPTALRTTISDVRATADFLAARGAEPGARPVPQRTS